MALIRETVAIPFSSGIQPSTRARLLDPQKLLVAQNCAFLLEQGPQRRNGHFSRAVRTSASYVGNNGVSAPAAAPVRETYSTANPNLPSSWLYGWGIYGTERALTTNPYEVSPQPNVGQLFGATTRDSEVVTWDGHRVFSYAPNQASLFGETQFGSSASTTRGPACMPSMRAEAIAKIADAQLSPDAADNGVMRVAAWLNGDGITGGYSAFDSGNKTALVSNAQLVFQTPKALRCISVGPWFHILVSDTTANSLEMRSFHQDTPTTVISRSLGTVDIQFDVKKVDETQFVVFRRKGTAINANVIQADGTTLTTFSPNTGAFPIVAGGTLAIAINENKHIGLVWDGTGHVIRFAAFNLAGGLASDSTTVTTTALSSRLTISPRTQHKATHSAQWDVFVEDEIGAVAQVRSYAVDADITGSAATIITTRHRVIIASHAFHVGNRSFLWLTPAPIFTGTILLQATWFLCDSALGPVGKLDYGQANADVGVTKLTLPSVNWHTEDNLQPFKDRIVYHGALPYNQRVTNVAVGNPTPNGVFTESSIRFYELDFLPQLRAGQAGRCTYFAGAQLWCYDGSEVVEAGFHMTPEGVQGVASGGGTLSAGTYRYRVDLCHKNAQGEEVRSWSLITSGIVAALNDRITVTIPGVPMTRREDSYFLIFRTEANGTIFYLTNSRDPQSANFRRNALNTATFTYIDTLSDALLRVREYHPANSGGNYIDPLPAPACELVAAGRDRLWLAGGELSPGEVAPSRLFFPGQAPAFSPALNIQVDRNAEPITAIGFVGDIAAVFRRTSTYTIDSDGPDNSLVGAWPQPRLAVADTGAVGPEGLALTVVGLWFQSPAGIRLLNEAGRMDSRAGQDVDPLTALGKYASAVVVPQYTQVRWYSRDASKPSIVIDYSSNAWSTWTGLTSVGSVFWPVSNMAVIATGEGNLMTESDQVFTDAGTSYEMIVRVSWLHAAQLGDFQRVRRLALFGSAEAPLNLRTRIFYDERDFHSEELIREFPVADGLNSQSVFNTSIWGGFDDATEWGNFSIWGDGVNVTANEGLGLSFRDGVFKLRLRPARQKCSVISIEFSDQGAPHSGFVPVVLALELARRDGLDRIPTP